MEGRSSVDVELGHRSFGAGSTLPHSAVSAPTSRNSAGSIPSKLWRQSRRVYESKGSWWSNLKFPTWVSSTDIPEDDEDDRQLVVRQLQKCPDGYPRLGAFLDSDDNFRVYRRFGYLQSRLLLDKQEHLRQLEEELDTLDEEDARKESRNLITMENYDATQYRPRRELMRKIEYQFKRYASLLQAAQSLTHCNRPSSSEFKSVENFINNRHPLVPSEESFIYRKEDLITLRPGREHAWLDCSVEKILRFSRCRFIQDIFRSKEAKQKTDGIEKYYTRHRIEYFVITIIVLMILALLIVPIYILYRLTNDMETPRSNGICVAILLIFTLSFSACASLFTRAKRHEILAAAAAYCAVLVVFLANVDSRVVSRRSNIAF